MNVLHEIGALLEQFQQSQWQDLYVRTARYSLFIAKAGGGANPMLGAAAAHGDQAGEQSAQSDQPPAVLLAPHLATVASLLPSGSAVQSGTVVGQLDVLGQFEPLVSDRSGRLEALVTAGTLVEYQTPLLRIA